MINFRLRDINSIKQFGEPPNLNLHWFGLTDGDLWIELGESTIYKYTDEAVAYFEDKDSNYNDYQIARFIEDFSDLFRSIGESIPHKLYQVVDFLTQCLVKLDKR